MPPKFAPSGPLVLVMKKVMLGNCGGGACALPEALHANGTASATRAKHVFLDIFSPKPIHDRQGRGRRMAPPPTSCRFTKPCDGLCCKCSGLTVALLPRSLRCRDYVRSLRHWVRG